MLLLFCRNIENTRQQASVLLWILSKGFRFKKSTFYYTVHKSCMRSLKYFETSIQSQWNDRSLSDKLSTIFGQLMKDQTSGHNRYSVHSFSPLSLFMSINRKCEAVRVIGHLCSWTSNDLIYQLMVGKGLSPGYASSLQVFTGNGQYWASVYIYS